MIKLMRFIKLILFIALCEGIGVLGSVFTISQIPTWYITLNKPFFSPPNFVFGPVWTMLYALMGIAVFLIYEAKIKKKEKSFLLKLFGLQLLLNFLWSFIFFGMHNPIIGFVEIILLWISILILIIKFYKYSKLASVLLIPYLFWVSFATLLNLFIAILN